MLLGLWTFLLSVLGDGNVPDTRAVHLKGEALLFWVQQSRDSFAFVCGRGMESSHCKTHEPVPPLSQEIFSISLTFAP